MVNYFFPSLLTKYVILSDRTWVYIIMFFVFSCFLLVGDFISVKFAVPSVKLTNLHSGPFIGKNNNRKSKTGIAFANAFLRIKKEGITYHKIKYNRLNIVRARTYFLVLQFFFFFADLLQRLHRRLRRVPDGARRIFPFSRLFVNRTRISRKYP